jgi:serine/threonine protein kinase
MKGAFAVGEWIGGRFQVFDVHEGGMSLVYVVNDHLGETGPKVVALKTLREELLRSRVRVSRFAAECRLWVQLGEHPNVVRAYSVEVIDDRPYVALELIQGGDLNRWIGTPRLDLRRAIRLGVQFCQGMEHALRQGLQCHRDIKPGNLLITEAGSLKITDFGLARVCEEMIAVRRELPDGSIPLDEAPAHQPIIWTDPRDWTNPAQTDQATSAPPKARSRTAGRALGPGMATPSLRTAAISPATTKARSPITLPAAGKPADRGADCQTAATVARDSAQRLTTADPRLTRVGAKLGTGPYMAPEQFRDPRSVDVRADIYAFGIVLYEMIAAELPFKARSMEDLDHQHTFERSPSIYPFIPGRHSRLASQIDEIIQRCLKKDRGDRYQSVADLRKALKALLEQLPKR